jgi:phosphoglycolate phosphatase
VADGPPATPVAKPVLVLFEVDETLVFVVGDTPRDIEAAQTAGAVSVGVASGHFSTTELRAAGGDHVLGSLEEPFPGL